MTLEQPASYFLRLAATWTLMPLRQDIDREGTAISWTEPGNIVTNGPFMLKEWQHDTRIVLERNENYWGPKPSLQRATYRLFPEDGAEQMLAAYEAGEIDTTGAGVPAELPTSQMDRIMADPTLSASSSRSSSPARHSSIVNHRKPAPQGPARAAGARAWRSIAPQILDAVLKRAGEPA